MFTAPEGPVTAASPFINGAGAEQTQQPRARARTTDTLLAAPVAGGHLMGNPHNVAFGDFRNPQVIPVHPRIDELALDSAIPGETSTPRLPGRLPASIWDGEPGAGAPNLIGDR